MSGGIAAFGVLVMPGLSLIPRDTTLFESALGDYQGRLERDDGTAVFVLGAAVSNLRGRVEVGDWVEVAQDIDCTGLHLVRLAGVVRVPHDAPLGANWVLSIRTPSERLTEWPLRPGTRRLDDVVANVSRLVGVHRIAVRLSLEAA